MKQPPATIQGWLPKDPVITRYAPIHSAPGRVRSKALDFEKNEMAKILELEVIQSAQTE